MSVLPGEAQHPWLDHLGDVLHLVYYDHRGNGRSGRPPAETITFEQLCADALRAHLGFEKVAVLGHSFGVFVALEYGLRYHERLERLILLGTSPAFDHGEEVEANARLKGATRHQVEPHPPSGRDKRAHADPRGPGRLRVPPSQAEIMHEGIPNSELVVFEKSGHFAHAEEPAFFFEAVRRWLRRT